MLCPAIGESALAAVALALILLAAGWRSWIAWLWTRGLSPPRKRATEGRVTLILPYAPPGALAPLFEALAAQELRPMRVILSIARPEDAPRLPPLPFACDIIVAGLASNRGQKSQNLLAALARLDGTEDVVVLIDADIRPQPWWLSALAAPILRGRQDLVGGYRWSMPCPSSLQAQAIAWLDRGWAMLPKPSACRLAWGGSLAFAPRHVDLIRTALGHGISDDLMIARHAHAGRLRTRIRGTVLLPSPLDRTGAVSFWSRQLRILRLYHPTMWWGQAVASHLFLLFWFGSLALGCFWVLSLLVAAQLLRVVLHDVTGRRIGSPDAAATRLWQFFLVLLPLAEILGMLCVWRSAFGREVTWRGITYRIAPGGAAEVVRRAGP